MSFQSLSFGILNDDVIGLTESQRTSVDFTAALSIVTEGPAIYKNFSYPRFQDFYGRAQIMSGAFVVQDIRLSYLNQELLHFRHIETGLVETIGCYFKAYGSADVPPVNLVTNTFLTRERLTSIRFRLRQGVQANLVLAWEVFDAKCGGNIIPPEESQGKPPGPQNSGYNPGNRPGAQGGDPEDNSPNDGGAVPPGQNEPPKPGGPSVNAQWRVAVSGLKNPPDCSPLAGVFNTGVSDPTAKISAVAGPDPAGGFGCGVPVKQLIATSNGVAIPGAGDVRAPGMVVVSVDYY